MARNYRASKRSITAFESRVHCLRCQRCTRLAQSLYVIRYAWPSNSVNSGTRNRESQWSSRSSNTRSKQPPIRLAPNRGTTPGLLGADPVQTQCRECRLVVHRRVELASTPTHFDAAIPAVKLERRLLSTHPDPLPALRDFRLSCCRVRCAVLLRCTPLVRFADGTSRVV